MDWSPRYLLYSNEWLEERNRELFCKYSDPYYKPLKNQDLRELLEEIPVDLEECQEIKETRKEIMDFC